MRALLWSLLLAGVVIGLWLLVVWLEHRDDARKRDAGAIVSSPESPPGLPWLLRCGQCHGPGTNGKRLSKSASSCRSRSRPTSASSTPTAGRKQSAPGNAGAADSAGQEAPGGDRGASCDHGARAVGSSSATAWWRSCRAWGRPAETRCGGPTFRPATDVECRGLLRALLVDAPRRHCSRHLA
jgi:hypothetical protein